MNLLKIAEEDKNKVPIILAFPILETACTNKECKYNGDKPACYLPYYEKSSEY